MTGDKQWTALSDSIRQDLMRVRVRVRMRTLSARDLVQFMPGHRSRVIRLMNMHPSMMQEMKECTGSAQVLGDLEKAIMETLWDLGEPATVTEVVSAMPGEARAYHTVTRLMVRLCEKHLLQRRKSGGVWHHAPRLSHEQFRRQIAEEVIAGVYALAPESAVNSMLDLVDASSPDGLDALAELIEQKRRERRG